MRPPLKAHRLAVATILAMSLRRGPVREAGDLAANRTQRAWSALRTRTQRVESDVDSEDVRAMMYSPIKRDFESIKSPSHRSLESEILEEEEKEAPRAEDLVPRKKPKPEPKKPSMPSRSR